MIKGLEFKFQWIVQKIIFIGLVPVDTGLKNSGQIHLVLASGKLELQKSEH